MSKANDPVSEQSERASRYNVGFPNGFSASESLWQNRIILFYSPKRLLKKAKFPVNKFFWPFFRITECDKPSGTIYKGLQGILTITVEVKKSFL